MKTALEILGIVLAAPIALALQMLHVGLHNEQFSFGDGWDSHVGTAASSSPRPKHAAEVADNSARLA